MEPSAVGDSPSLVSLVDVTPHVNSPWPFPGDGATVERFRSLADLARRDLPLAKIVEPHHDAAAILRDLDGPAVEPDSVWAVWAAEPPFAQLEARETAEGFVLSGRKAFCSGATTATNALVTAGTPEGARLFSIDVRSAGLAIDHRAAQWSGHGMRRADTRSLQLDEVPAVAIGAAGDYTARPGFWHGAIGIAACWFGGARGVADTVESAGGRLDAHGLAHLGAIRADLDNLGAVLRDAAHRIDAAPDVPAEQAERLALSVRALAADVVDRVIARAGRALGPAPLVYDRRHSDHVADLVVFVRQHHAERDLERLGGIGQQHD
ncbi:acyl-CoA dehydrogenase family protein [Aeromicrobium sp.]|uniref:acyl-CoA dehydrogenase family protein n=1 Tax=Aeromicrobium sp. TaxID=1871063 RepID=UPI0030C0D0B3